MAEKEPDNPKQPKDDRNIAKVDGDTVGLTPDEQLTLVWDKYKKVIINTAVLGLVVALAWFGYKAFSTKKLEAVRKEYSKAQIADKAKQEEQKKTDDFNPRKDVLSLERTITFAQKHPHHPLAGYARIEAGHAYLQVDNFEEAAIHYQAAVEALAKVPEFAGFAHLHYAISTYRSGDKNTGKAQLKSISQNMDYLHVHRGEAYYKLGVIALSEKNMDAYKKHEAGLENAGLEHSTSWLESLRTFRKHFPKDGFDTLGPIPAKIVSKPPAPVSATGGISATGGVSTTGGASATGGATPTGGTKTN